jgi:hypothetical protein
MQGAAPIQTDGCRSRDRPGSDLLYHSSLRIEVGLDVSLRRPKVRMSCEHLNVAERPPTVEILRAVFVMKVRLPL